MSDWGIQDIGRPFSSGQGCDGRELRARRGTVGGRDARLRLVLGQRFRPARRDRSRAPRLYRPDRLRPEADGDAHSSQYDEARRLLIGADEDFCKASGSETEKGFGYLRVYDYSQPSAPQQIGVYRTPNSTDDRRRGRRLRHPQQLPRRDDLVHVVVLGRRPRDRPVRPDRAAEVAYFVPPANTNPVKPSQRRVLSNTTQVTGRRRRRGDRPRLCERHELRALDPAQNRLAQVAGRRQEALPPRGSQHRSRARPEGVQGLRRPRRPSGRARREGRLRDRPRVRRALRAAPNRSRS